MSTYVHKGLVPDAELDVLFKEGTGDDEVLDFVGALVDAGDAQVAVPALDRHFAGVAHAAVNLHDAINDAVCHV